jgi:WhiB family redox-sensing transcriptional regulator
MTGARRDFVLIDTRASNGDSRGLCTLDDTQLWDGDTKADAEEARTTCGRCPIRDACLTNALNEEGGIVHTARGGIRGGLTTAERAALWRKLHRKPAAA